MFPETSAGLRKGNLPNPGFVDVSAHRGWDCVWKLPLWYPSAKGQKPWAGSRKVIITQVMANRESWRFTEGTRERWGDIGASPRWHFLAIRNRAWQERKLSLPPQGG